MVWQVGLQAEPEAVCGQGVCAEARTQQAHCRHGGQATGGAALSQSLHSLIVKAAADILYEDLMGLLECPNQAGHR